MADNSEQTHPAETTQPHSEVSTPTPEPAAAPTSAPAPAPLTQSQTCISATISQLINFDGEFLDVLKEKIFHGWDFTSKGYDYWVVAILGPQSSGKSTLLNVLFGTEFPVLSAQTGRKQTTQGIWVARANQADIFVMDVEGTDSRERAMTEDSLAFERKTSLFSLALAQVLLINLWEHDVGRYNASNKPLLKIVFELNLELFQKSKKGKTMLLFVIRDHDESETPLERLKATIESDIHDIWKDVNKPPELAKSEVTEFFDLVYTGLPHKRKEAKLFDQKASQLKSRFYQSSSSEYILGTYRAEVPSDGFSQYAHTIWETIKSNKELDIPSQKEMLAIYRCDEIADAAYKGFEADIKPLTDLVKSGTFLEDFGSKFSTLIKKRLEEYDRPSSRYHSDVPAKKREALLSNMIKALHDLFILQVHKAKQLSITFFEQKFHGSLPSGAAAKNFIDLAAQSKDQAVRHFEDLVQASMIEKSGWTFEVDQHELITKIDEVVNAEKKNQLELLQKEIKAILSQSLGGPLSRLLGSPETGLWAKIRELFNNTTKKSEDLLVERLTDGFKIAAHEVENEKAKLRELCLTTVKEKVHEKAKYLTNEMENAFDDTFKRDPAGLPRVWKDLEELETPFRNGKQKGKLVLELTSVIRLDPKLDNYSIFEATGDVDPELMVLSYDQAKQLLQSFTRYCETSYANAQAVVENSQSKKNVPMYFLVLLFVLGFNEIMWVLWNPVYFFLLLLLGGIAYAGYVLNLGGVYLNVAEASFNNFVNLVKDLLRKYLEHPQAAKAHRD